MLHFIFMVLPGILSVSIIYGTKNKEKLDLLKRDFSIFNLLRDFSIMVFLINILGITVGKSLTGITYTFVGSDLNPNLISLTYLSLVFILSLVLGFLFKFLKENVEIYFSKEKIVPVKKKKNAKKEEKIND